MATATPQAIPEQGQIVTVRQRQYVVTDVLPSALPPPQPGSLAGPQHLVTLNAIEDDAVGESLQVIWEVEPGARTVERIELPEPSGFDPPARLDAFLDAVRWGAIASADVRALQAPFRSGIDIEDYQLDPLVRAVGMPRVSLLIADDVGLCKTVEAGLVIQELIVRNRARTVLVVCPAGLQAHWRDQMRDKFGLEFRIVDSALMRQLARRPAQPAPIGGGDGAPPEVGAGGLGWQATLSHTAAGSHRGGLRRGGEAGARLAAGVHAAPGAKRARRGRAVRHGVRA